MPEKQNLKGDLFASVCIYIVFACNKKIIMKWHRSVLNILKLEVGTRTFQCNYIGKGTKKQRQKTTSLDT